MSTTTSRRLDTRDRTIYEVNVRQYTPEGTFDAFLPHLDRLADLGVGMLWFMPIHPISKKNRKGSLGSYYAIADYDAINPEFGDAASFKRVVDAAHERGMHVIIDWVPNHTGCDHPWTESHPERYQKPPKEQKEGPFAYGADDWTDTYRLDYTSPDTCAAMRETMLRWIRDFDLDGFRVDVAAMVRREFWEETIPALRAEKEIFLLAEAEEKWIHDVGFDATYAWPLGHTVLAVVDGKKKPEAIRTQVLDDAVLVGDGFRMHFTTNHDWNSWEGVAADRLGGAHDAAVVLSFTLPGKPLIYSGQESGLDRALEFFEKDPIAWRDHEHGELFRTMAHLKRAEPALHHGPEGGSLEMLDVGNEHVVAFRRVKGDSRVTVLANMSAIPAGVRVDTGDATLIDEHGDRVSAPSSLGPWEWAVLRDVR
ncbi:MAG: alpha-amylase family glycosyl hydrolase [Phycisphaerales bacterium]